ncbi:SAM-dependent methyltransferase [Actinoplanes octamycinicus]|uniref:SAM-dependent methyltransferase n=1 Tax=Actinoplanes octamycinicus TaxID=135948 RepID=A0A7W7M6U8_9ACTN|nr:methyltransferase domain-containing protein [Actinoplanes octamycinicus]MBB4739143.1 SAM-dependent methyltransferase [Actinoplanes octamycinicus]GIE58882.1 hypothetical protein Aoc01nite_42840 [Actinoplanes octamycinicus]
MTTVLPPSNFLHDRPDLYDRVIPEAGDAALSRFARDMVLAHAPGRTVLDVGCGLGRELAALRAGGLAADGLDASPAMVAAARAASPGSRVWTGSMTGFELGQTFAAVLCLGSTFLYNHTVADIRATLAAFHRHLQPDGLLVLEMRNAAHFLTPEGQRLLRHERADDVPLDRGHLRYTTRLEIDPATQLLDRYYTWQPPTGPPVVEHLRHRLLFPQELAAHLDRAGFTVLDMFDDPAPALGRYAGPGPVSRTLTGRRLHVLARRTGAAS